MNFLAHLWLAGDDEGLRLGALLGDFIRGGLDNKGLPKPIQRGILLHRHVDHFIDDLPEMAALRQQFLPPFRRYSGIIIDVAFDHELAVRWEAYSSVSLAQFDSDLRQLLARYGALLPDDLRQLMRYADRRGLFAAYRDESEILVTLSGIGRRLSRPNPLYRVSEIWPTMRPVFSSGFDQIFPQVQRSVTTWLGASVAEERAQRTA